MACENCKVLQAKVEEMECRMRIHAGDICSANNEAERYIISNQELEEENDNLRKEIKRLKGE